MQQLGIGGHQSARNESEVWLTPPDLIRALGEFDLDPCAAPLPRPWSTAREHITLPDDGLLEQWHGRVWLNPPYGQWTGQWLKKLSAHGNGIALIFARTETEDWCRHIWAQGAANGIIFLKDRLYFYRPDGKRADANGGAPSALVAYGLENVAAIRRSRLKGSLVSGWENLPAMF